MPAAALAEFLISLLVKYGPEIYDEVAKLLAHPDVTPATRADVHARIAAVLPTEADALRLRGVS